MTASPNKLFDYTSGRWIFNDAPRHEERRTVFNVAELRRLAAQSVNRGPDDVIGLEKLAEGGFNRTFLITMRDGFEMVARIPYPSTTPKHFAVASEVATIALLRSSGLPAPDVYGYSVESNNAAGTEYIFMEFLKGTKLSDIWFDLEEEDIISVSRELAKFESKMMSIAFPAGGSLYFAKDLEALTGKPGIPMEDARFCVGPDTRLSLWYGRRSQLDVDRGPYESAESSLVKGAYKELAYLKQFGRPLYPFERIRREDYHYQKQPPSDHVENLNRFLRIATSIIPNNPDLGRFGVHHPDLQPGNIIVSRSTDSSLNVVGLLDWQHTSILPKFLLAGVPKHFQNYDDPISQSVTQPLLPENLDDLDENGRSPQKELYRRRLVHYHYVKNTEEYNTLHYTALADPVGALRRRLFTYASDPWEGETLPLKVALIGATKNWDVLAGEHHAPCPIAFDAKDISETMKLDEMQRVADANLQALYAMVGCGAEGWVSNEHYDQAVAINKEMRDEILADAMADEATSDEERANIAAHWPLDDMDEGEYM